MTAVLAAAAIVIVLIVLVISSSVKVLREYERGVIFRLGRLTGDAKGPGLFLLIPIIDRIVRIDLRIVTLQVPPQDIISKDNVPVRVTAVVYFRIVDPRAAVVAIENYLVGTSQIAQTTLRSVLGQHSLDELLAERDRINEILQGIIDQQTEPWGVKVTVVEVKDVELPSGMQRAMARQAEAERERRAKIIGAEGEFQASEKLAQAAEVLSRDPAALQLRYLQTLLEIAGGSNNASTTIFPIPIDLLRPFAEAAQRYADGGNLPAPPAPPPPPAVPAPATK
jgi:regulator of protease activity HflC (stomatin/prohibitin superfamily)